MAATAFTFPLIGTPTGVSYELRFYAAGTNTLANVYKTSAPATAWSVPIVLNADGQPDDPIYCVQGVALKVAYVDENGVDVPGYPFDNWFPPLVS